MKQYYVVRCGWNAANQSAMCRPSKPRNTFESGFRMLIGIEKDESLQVVLDKFKGSCYPNQGLEVYTNPRAVAGLLDEIRRHIEIRSYLDPEENA